MRNTLTLVPTAHVCLCVRHALREESVKCSNCLNKSAALRTMPSKSGTGTDHVSPLCGGARSTDANSLSAPSAPKRAGSCREPRFVTAEELWHDDTLSGTMSGGSNATYKRRSIKPHGIPATSGLQHFLAESGGQEGSVQQHHQPPRASLTCPPVAREGRIVGGWIVCKNKC